MVIDNAFNLGQIVFLITDPDQLRRIVTKITISANGIVYELGCGANASDHYECEISETSSILAKIE